jgi:anaerobic selenocysteine-containing dehydrogenase
MKRQMATGSGAERRATREDGIYRSACRMCHGGCGVLLHLENGRLVRVWGHNPLDSGPDGELGFRVREALRSKPKLIVVDPRGTQLARKAEAPTA